MRWHYVICGLGLLFLSSYLDTVRGPLLPILTQTLALKYSQTSWFLILGNIAAIGMTFLLIPLVRWRGEKSLTLWILLFLSTAVLGALWVERFSRLLAFAFFLGAGVAMAGAVTNLLVIRGSDLSHRSRTLCALHLMYGLGSLVAPFVVKLGVAEGTHWTWLIAGAAPLLVLLACTIQLWIPNEPPVPEVKEPRSAEKLSLQMLVVLAFALYVGGEVTLSMWMVTYLVDFRHLSLTVAPLYASGFFVMMSLTRLGCVFYLPTTGEGKFLWGSLLLCCLFFVSGHLGWTLGFSLAGILGPYFPLFLAKVSREFPRRSQTLTLWILSCMQITLGLCHWLVGLFTDRMGIENTYWLPVFLIAMAMGTLFLYERNIRKSRAVPQLTGELRVGGVA